MERLRGPLLAVSAGSTVAALVAFFVLGERLGLFLLFFFLLLVTILVYAFGGSEGFVADDVRRADDPPPRKPPMGPTPPFN